ncbi:MAG: hypothetical protein J1G01_04160 [Clostridiales bacterium]|nr:hypothetical protein [Clostridiales bacterium]
MKRRLLIILTAVVMIVACAFGVLACTDDNKANDNFKEGKYYYWEDPDTIVYSVEFKGGILYMNGTRRGTYTIKGDKMIIKSDNPNDEEPSMELIIVSEGCIKIPFAAGRQYCAYYVIEGQNPPQDRELWKN